MVSFRGVSLVSDSFNLFLLETGGEDSLVGSSTPLPLSGAFDGIVETNYMSVTAETHTQKCKHNVQRC